MRKTICIAGKNRIAVEGLRYILTNHNNDDILFIPNDTDDGINSWQPSLKYFGSNNNARETTLEEIYSLPNLVFISLEFAELVNPALFKSTELFNIHFSLLPKYKGMYTSTLPLINGENKSGVTLHMIDKGIDTGDIIDQLEFDIDITDTARDLYFKYLKYSTDLFIKNIESLLSKTYKTRPQPALHSTYYSRSSINYSNISIDLRKTAFQIHNHFRALIFKEYQLPTFNECKICRTDILDKRSIHRPGLIVEDCNDYCIVSTIDYDVILYKAKAD